MAVAAVSANSQSKSDIYLVEIAPCGDSERYFTEADRIHTSLSSVVAGIVSGEIRDVFRVLRIVGAYDDARGGVWLDATKDVAGLVANDALTQERILPHETIEWLDGLVRLTFRERVYLRGEAYEETVANDRADHVVSLRKSEAV